MNILGVLSSLVLFSVWAMNISAQPSAECLQSAIVLTSPNYWYYNTISYEEPHLCFNFTVPANPPENLILTMFAVC